MARLNRVSPVGVAQHIVQRGNNRQVCFGDQADMKAYLHWLLEYSKKFSVSIHSWVLMSNHVHILCTPQEEGAVSKMMQAVGRRYVQYFNHTYGRSGTLWEGRYRANVVQSIDYLLQVYRYIELNPVRANLVRNPEDYPWSSYAINGLGKQSELCTTHEEYIKLGDTNEARTQAYRKLFAAHVEDSDMQAISKCVNSGIAYGNNRFVEEIEKISGQRVSARQKGRPKKPKENDSNLDQNDKIT